MTVVEKKPPSAFNFVGSVVIFLLLPPFVYYLWICATQFDGALYVPHNWPEVVDLVRRVPLPTVRSVAIFTGWMLFQGLLQIYGPGKWVEGTELRDGTRLKYKMNGVFAWWGTWAVLLVLMLGGWFDLASLYDDFGPLLTTVNLFTYPFCLFLYVLGKLSDKPERISGNAFYDYFLGNALNPRVGNFDFKLFCEARPGLIAWVVIDVALAFKQHQLHGHISTPMLLVCLFHFWYIADYYHHEDAILTTWDIRHENFGWMLCWGDLVWVPFTYTLQAFYLLVHTHDLPWYATLAIAALNFTGYYIFRSVNIQKHRFRMDPSRPIWGRTPTYIRTKRNTLLLTSGWWGIARHLNYFGDLIMGLAWCLPCGFKHPLPYFYIAYFTILLVHRERRDHAMCMERYGEDWETYCKQVRWRIIPGIY